MKIQHKILLYSSIAVIFISVFVSMSMGGGADAFGESFAASFGIISMIGGAIYLFIGIILLIAGSKDLAQGFLLSGGIFLLIGFATCSIMLNGTKL